ncbi:hypothetical protein [Mycolicibacterium chubuense]|uniref:hypothetical protein n=1 Tax=Mycolicibacterium chubuense TaxID=1800 RepID=UPI00130169E6|nr:hypothetical protein [Mycolicibacterium chubuense]
MTDEVIMINGRPGAGKTTVGAALAEKMPTQPFSVVRASKRRRKSRHKIPPSDLMQNDEKLESERDTPWR